LEETRELNSRLQLLQKETENRVKKYEEEKAGLVTSKEQPDNIITLTGSTNEKVMLSVSHLLYIEAVGNYVKVVHWLEGQVRSDMLRATSKQMEDTLHTYPMIVRSHRAFIVNLGQVEHIVSNSGSMQLVMKHSHDTIPVSRSKVAAIKETIKGILQY
jgi:DNA-binding LytR/AlgR family response regulator